jgi:hypothetical protein
MYTARTNNADRSQIEVRRVLSMFEWSSTQHRGIKQMGLDVRYSDRRESREGLE